MTVFPQETLGDSSYQEVFGHKFVRQPRQTKLHVTPPTCEGCGKRVRGLIRPWYMCNSKYNLYTSMQ